MSDLEQKTGNATAGMCVRDRLLEVAERLFCEKGFDGASIRDIAAAADCNVASVNYYFGGKKSLYEEIWRRYLIQMRDVRLESIEDVMSRNGGKPPLEELLKSFAYSFIGPWVGEERTRRLMILMSREMIDPRLPANVVLDDVINPTIAAMGKALIETCPGVDESKIPLMIFSIAGQLIHAVRIKAMFEQNYHAEIPDVNMGDAIEHIVKFSAGGIRAYVEGLSE